MSAVASPANAERPNSRPESCRNKSSGGRASPWIFRFRVLGLQTFCGPAQQTVVNSLWRIEKDVPVRVNREVIAYAELQAVGDRLAVRLTDLARGSEASKGER